MEIKIACSLDGRDLALIRSLININNIYGDLVLQYTEDARHCQVLIAKDYHNHGSVYYAMNRATGEKTHIKPELNPKTVRALFERLSSLVQPQPQPLDTTGLYSLEELVLKHTSSSADDHVAVTTPHVSFIMDKRNNTLFADQPITDQWLKAFTHTPLNKVEFTVSAETVNSADHPYTEPLELFKWQLGFSLSDRLITADHQSPLKAFKQISWPNYGECPCRNEFIRLSSMLWKRSESYAELIEHSGFDRAVINQFLNATLMAGNVVVVDAAHSQEGRVMNNSSPFLEGLKRLFTFR
jgi:hypothetical protein